MITKDGYIFERRLIEKHVQVRPHAPALSSLTSEPEPVFARTHICPT